MSILESLHAIQIAKSFSDAAKEVSSSKWGAARLIVGTVATVAGFVFGGIPGALLGLSVSELFFQAAPAAWHWMENKWHNWFGQAQAVPPSTQTAIQSVTEQPSVSNQASILKGLGQTMGGLAQAGHQVVDEALNGEASIVKKASLPVPRPSAIERHLEDELQKVTHSLRM